MVVDDEMIVRESFLQWFKKSGHVTDTAKSGFEALKKLDEYHYFMVGKWSLAREIGDIAGHFSLIWGRINDDWVIIADHSS